MSMTVTIEIPALDRLCAWLEGRDKADVVNAVEEEIVAKLKEAAEGGVPRPEFEEAPVTEEHPWKDEAKAPTQEKPTAAAGTSSAPDGAPSPEGKAKEAKAVTLADVQRVAAQMRDEGKLGQVTGMFKEFGIKRLSDLQGDALQQFAGRLRGMGAKI